MTWALDWAPDSEQPAILGNVDRPLDGTLISVCHLGDCPPERLPCFGLVVEERPEDCSPHCGPVTR